MRLSLCVLLVTLALCCYEANATVCPAYLGQIKSFFFDDPMLYNIKLLAFFPPREAAEAKLKVKQCIDQIPRENREKIYNVVGDIVSTCNN